MPYFIVAEVIKRSVNRLQEKLEGETPAATFRWDKVESTKAVVANREVVIRQGT